MALAAPSSGPSAPDAGLAPRALVKRLGAEILDGPGEFPYDPAGWYAVYFLGLDGLKFEVVRHSTSVKIYAGMMHLASHAMKG